MGLSPAQGELNAALKPLFTHIPQAHVLHDDLIVATKDDAEHLQVMEEVMRTLEKSGITLNPDKCVFFSDEIQLWGMIFSKYGVKPDPKKIEALNHIEAPI